MHTDPIRFRRFNYWRPLRFDFYVLGETLGTFFGACIFILFVLLMFQALRLAEFFIVHGTPGLLLGKMTFFIGLSFLPTALPLAFLISILISFGRLSSDSELVALKASGLSIYRLAAPMFLFGAAVVVLSILLNNQWVPWGEISFKKTQIKIGNTKAVSAVREGTFTPGFFDLLIFADKVDNERNRLHRVFIFDEREAKNPLTYVSKSADIVSVKTGSELGSAIVLRLHKGSMHHNDLETHTYEKIDFDTYHLYLKVAEGIDTTLLKPRMILQDDLLDRIKRFPISTYEGREFRGEFWRRYATAFSPLIFVLIGIGFGTYQYRTAKSGAILTGFVVLFIYWALQTYGTTALLQGKIAPFIAMQIPNGVMLLAGIYSFRRASW